MQKFIFVLMMALSFIAHAEEGDLDVISDKASEDDLFEKPVYKEVQPKRVTEVTAPVAVPNRAPAAAVVPQRFVDKELNIACYYLAPADSVVATSMYAAINCVKLEDPEEKLQREQERRERQLDRAKKESSEQARQEREAYEANQKTLQDIRKKNK